MAKYTKEQLKKKIADSQKKIEQMDHQIERIKRKEAYLDKKPWQLERSKRTHRLVNKGGIIEHFFPDTASFKEDDFYQLVEYIFYDEAMRMALLEMIKRVKIERGDVVYSPTLTGYTEGKENWT